MSSTDFTDELVLAVDKVCSAEYEQMFEIVAKDQPDHLSRNQHTLLSSYPHLITWYEGDRRPEIVERIRHTHLNGSITGLVSIIPAYHRTLSGDRL